MPKPVDRKRLRAVRYQAHQRRRRGSRCRRRANCAAVSGQLDVAPVEYEGLPVGAGVSRGHAMPSGSEFYRWVAGRTDTCPTPNVTGIELYDTLLSARPEQAQRFVFLTGGATTEAARAFLARVGVARPIVDKPFLDLAELRAQFRPSRPRPSSRAGGAAGPVTQPRRVQHAHSPRASTTHRASPQRSHGACLSAHHGTSIGGPAVPFQHGQVLRGCGFRKRVRYAIRRDGGACDDGKSRLYGKRGDDVGRRVGV